MANVTVIGAQWGDEGKGKIVDWLASRADAVVRFQGSLDHPPFRVTLPFWCRHFAALPFCCINPMAS